MSKLLDAVIEKIKGIDDNELHSINSTLHHNEIAIATENLFNNISLKAEDKKIIKDVFVTANGSVDSKLDFLYNSNILNTDSLFNMPSQYRTVSDNLNDDLYDKHKDVVSDVFPFFIKWKPDIARASIGNGELFLLLFSNETTKRYSGDIQFEDRCIEVKGDDGRFISNEGVARPSDVYSSFVSILDSSDVDLNIDTTNKNTYNLHTKGINNLNSLMVDVTDVSWVVETLNNSIETLYTDCSSLNIYPDMSAAVNNNAEISPKKFVREFSKFQFDYYKASEGFDGVLFVNNKSYSTMYIETGSELLDNFDNFKIHASFSWNQADNRNSGYKFTLK